MEAIMNEENQWGGVVTADRVEGPVEPFVIDDVSKHWEV